MKTRLYNISAFLNHLFPHNLFLITSTTMPPYYDMCKAAIKALKERNGSSGAAIKKVSCSLHVVIAHL